MVFFSCFLTTFLSEFKENGLMHRTLCILKLVHPGFILIICITELKKKNQMSSARTVKEGALQIAALHQHLTKM